MISINQKLKVLLKFISPEKTLELVNQSTYFDLSRYRFG